MVEKNKRKEQARKLRVTNGMNTGTRTHKSKKHPSRQQEKQRIRKEMI